MPKVCYYGTQYGYGWCGHNPIAYSTGNQGYPIGSYVIAVIVLAAIIGFWVLVVRFLWNNGGRGKRNGS